MNIWDILILLAVAGIAAFSFFRAGKRKAEGKNSCCGNCCSCSMCSSPCSAQRNKQDE